MTTIDQLTKNLEDFHNSYKPEPRGIIDIDFNQKNLKPARGEIRIDLLGPRVRNAMKTLDYEIEEIKTRIKNLKQKPMKQQPFYMIYLEGERSPVYRHDTLQSAEIEAKRLTEIHNKKAYILVSLKSYHLQKFIETDCRPDDQLPF